jgi:mono/diheme cytochrome c family protein
MAGLVLFGGESKRVGIAIVIAAACSTFACGSKDDPPKDAVGRGHEAVVAQACETCHTPTTNPSATMSGADDPQPQSQAYPANLTPDDDTGIGTWDDDTLVKAILTGVDDENSPLCPPMPHFQDKGMTEAQARDIAAYLRSLPPVKHSVQESACPPIK